MTIIEGLIAQIEQQEEKEQAAREASLEMDTALLWQRAEGALGPDLLEELGAETRYSRNSWNERCPYIQLHYRGDKVYYLDSQRLNRNTPGQLKVQIAQEARAIDRKVAKREEKLERVRRDLRRMAPRVRDYYDWRRVRDWNTEFDDDPEVKRLKRVAETNFAIAVERRRTLDRQEDEEEAGRIIQALERVEDWDGLREIQWEVESVPADRPLRDMVVPHLDAARQRLMAQDTEREARRKQAEADAFHPFQYYHVHYGFVAREDGEEPYVDTSYIVTLSLAPLYSTWYVPINGVHVCLNHVVKTERIVVERPEDMPYWCPTVETEWGEIRVPPENAEEVTW